MKKLISLALAVLLAAALLPSSALAKAAAPCWTVPEGYNVHDYDKLAAFLELTDENGVKNGEKLSENYDVNDPETWGGRTIDWNEDGEEITVGIINWGEAGGEMRLASIRDYFYFTECFYMQGEQWVGALDLSDCTALTECCVSCHEVTSVDLSGCTALEAVDCNFNIDMTELLLDGCDRLTTLITSWCWSCAPIDLSAFPELLYLDCSGCDRWFDGRLDLSANPGLDTLICEYCNFEELDLSHTPWLRKLDCGNNLLTELDLSCVPLLYSLSIRYNPMELPELSLVPHVYELYVDGLGLTELDVSVLPELECLYCGYNELTELDVSMLPISDLYCQDNRLASLRLPAVSDSYAFYLYCGNNELTELTLPEFGEEVWYVEIDCRNNRLTELSVPFSAEYIGVCCSGNPMRELTIGENWQTAVRSVRAEGSGTIGYNSNCWDYDGDIYYSIGGVVIATPSDGEQFEGWYTPAGQLISTELMFDTEDFPYTDYVARFTGPDFVPGDVDGSGTVTVSDAIMALRGAMGILSLTDGQFERADMDGSGSVTVSDAIMILRKVMGIL